MKLAVSSFAWDAQRTEEARRILSRSGRVQGVELVLPMAFADPATATAGEVREVRQAWEQVGVPIVSVQSLAFGRPELQLLGEAPVRVRFLDHLVRMAELAAGLGAERMVFGSPANRRRGALTVEDAMQRSVDFFRTLAERVKALDVVVCVEPNPRIYADCDHIQRIEEAVELVQRVDHPAIRVQFDTGAILYAQREGAGPSVESVREALSISGHMHLSTPGLEGVHHEDRGLGALGELPLPWKDQEWLSIEIRTPPGTDLQDAITEAELAAASWFPIAPAE